MSSIVVRDLLSSMRSVGRRFPSPHHVGALLVGMDTEQVAVGRWVAPSFVGDSVLHR
jgi:hypothetical protein